VLASWNSLGRKSLLLEVEKSFTGMGFEREVRNSFLPEQRPEPRPEGPFEKRSPRI